MATRTMLVCPTTTVAPALLQTGRDSGGPCPPDRTPGANETPGRDGDDPFGGRNGEGGLPGDDRERTELVGNP